MTLKYTVSSPAWNSTLSGISKAPSYPHANFKGTVSASVASSLHIANSNVLTSLGSTKSISFLLLKYTFGPLRSIGAPGSYGTGFSQAAKATAARAHNIICFFIISFV